MVSPSHDIFVQIVHVGSAEGRPESSHFVQDATQRPYI